MRTSEAPLTRVLSAAAIAAVVVVTVAACERKTEDATPGSDTTTSAGAVGGRPIAGEPPAGATAAMVAEGDSIFHGEAANGLCFTCHGADAKGTQLAPSLVDEPWRTGDGTYQFIQDRVTQGMPNPTPPYTGPMLPMGGAQLSKDQIRAVSAYVYAISRNKPPRQ
jgi:mono/diheme cytochrome c family protein